MKATQIQLNIIANRANWHSDGAERAGARDLAMHLFPESSEEIERAITDHPINTRWDEFRTCKSREEQQRFLLPEHN